MGAGAVLGKMAASYALAKGKAAALKIGKKIVKKGASKVKGIISSKAKKHLPKEAVEAVHKAIDYKEKKSDAQPAKAQQQMVNRGRIKEHGEQAGAYTPGAMGEVKKQGFGARAAVYPSKKLMTEGRALTYGGAATMKTRR